ncbi:hypothetical protein [Streptomyces acidicola]|uniref:hypothetical protein n=1 Tax=Streptomyces acidicola TaxID=2596892 RepID=UPI001883733E|nr:hypothetical protein [Streptomyces acidicola]
MGHRVLFGPVGRRRMLSGAIGPRLALFLMSVRAGHLSDQTEAIESTLALAARPPR